MATHVTIAKLYTTVWPLISTFPTLAVCSNKNLYNTSQLQFSKTIQYYGLSRKKKSRRNQDGTFAKKLKDIVGYPVQVDINWESFTAFHMLNMIVSYIEPHL